MASKTDPMVQYRRYQINNESHCIDYKLSVSDEKNNIICRVGMKAGDLDDVMVINDTSDHQLLCIRQKVPRIHLTYGIYADDKEEYRLGTIQRAGFSLKHKYKIESVYGEYTIDRADGLLTHDYVLVREKKQVAQFNRKDAESTEMYSVTIDESVDVKEDLFILALVIIFSCAEHVHFIGEEVDE